MIRRLVYVGLGLLMAFFASLQLNDPDPEVWVTLYGLAAALFGLALVGWYRPWALFLVLGTYLGIGLTLVPGFLEWLLHHPLSDLTGAMSPERQYIEDSRELLGLLIAAFALAVLAIQNRDSRPVRRAR